MFVLVTAQIIEGVPWRAEHFPPNLANNLNVHCQNHARSAFYRKKILSGLIAWTHPQGNLKTHVPEVVCLCAFLTARVLVCVPPITLNLASLILGRKWASAALGRKSAFGRSPRVHWEGRGQRISVSPRHGTGCEDIVGNVNNRSNRGRAAACSQCNWPTWISI